MLDETELAGRYQLLRGALDAVDDTFAVYRAERDPSGAVTGLWLEEVNAVGAGWLGGGPRESLLGRELAEITPAAKDLGLWELMAAVVSGADLDALGRDLPTDGCARRRRIELRGPRPGTFEVSATPFGRDRVVVQFRDVTETARGERLLAAAYEATAAVRATLQTALDATSDAFAVYDLVLDEDLQPSQLRLVLMNAAGAAPLDTDPEELVGRDLREIFPAAESCGLWQAILDTVEGEVTRKVRIQERDASGAWIAAWDNTIAPVAGDRVVITWRDVTADEQRERDLAAAHDDARHAATHDPLTGAANRALVTEHVRQAIADGSECFAVAFLDLNGFKQINDTLGHDVGDQVLCAVAERLTRTLRAGDTVARLGGDEFVLLIRNLPETWDREGFVRRVRAAVERPLTLEDQVLRPRTSIGLVSCPPEPADLDHLLRTADERMYADKKACADPGRRDRDGRDAERRDDRDAERRDGRDAERRDGRARSVRSVRSARR